MDKHVLVPVPLQYEARTQRALCGLSDSVMERTRSPSRVEYSWHLHGSFVSMERAFISVSTKPQAQASMNSWLETDSGEFTFVMYLNTHSTLPIVMIQRFPSTMLGYKYWYRPCCDEPVRHEVTPLHQVKSSAMSRCQGASSDLGIFSIWLLYLCSSFLFTNWKSIVELHLLWT